MPPPRPRSRNRPTENTINGIQLSEYTIIYSDVELDFNRTAAEYIRDGIAAVSGVTLPVKLDTETEAGPCELLVGLTNRPASAEAATTKLGDWEFLVKPYDKSLALYGNEYMVAGAAYWFVHQNFTYQFSEVVIPAEGVITTPTFTEPKNAILVIGDGMGFNTLKLGAHYFEKNPARATLLAFSDYPQAPVAFRLPNQGQSYTHSADHDVTDSAAGGTALATGYKTDNGVVGLAPDGSVIKNLCELAMEKGKKTAVITTDKLTGATPADFSVHTSSRDNETDILAQQAESGINILYGENADNDVIVETLRSSLDTLTSGDNGFFMMYEEAHIDKRAHNDDEQGVYVAYARLNIALRALHEFLITIPTPYCFLPQTTKPAASSGTRQRRTTSSPRTAHTPVSTYLCSASAPARKCSRDTIHDNTFVAKFIARLMGEESFGDAARPETTDKDGLDTRETDAQTSSAAA